MTDIVPDPDSIARGRRRLRAVLEVLAEQTVPMSNEEAWAAAVERVPLEAWDRSSPNEKDVRYRYDLKWNLSTTYQHPGLLHFADASYRLTELGRLALIKHLSPEDLYQAALAGYRAWDRAREENLSAPTVDPGTQVVHGGGSAGHVFRAINPVLDAWRRGDSHLQHGTLAWSSDASNGLLAHLRAEPSQYPSLPEVGDDSSRPSPLTVWV